MKKTQAEFKVMGSAYGWARWRLRADSCMLYVGRRMGKATFIGVRLVCCLEGQKIKMKSGGVIWKRS